ncbi:MAG: hypothetical protein MHPSP_001240, partial [Paramarteilia canceri]
MNKSQPEQLSQENFLLQTFQEESRMMKEDTKDENQWNFSNLTAQTKYRANQLTAILEDKLSINFPFRNKRSVGNSNIE